jgi:hypothetical protein
MKRTNFPRNTQKKLAGAIARLEARTKLVDLDLAVTAKAFRKPNPPTVAEYRTKMNAELAHLKTLVK